MGLIADQLKASLDALAETEPRFADAIAETGYPEPRLSKPGYATLLRTIVGQQVSVAAAASVWNKLEALLGEGCARAAARRQARSPGDTPLPGRGALNGAALGPGAQWLITQTARFIPTA